MKAVTRGRKRHRVIAFLTVVATSGVATSERAVASDDCASAKLIQCNATTTVDNQTATTDPLDPLFSCMAGGPGPGAGSLWFKFSATDTSALVDTCQGNFPADDTLLAIYSADPADPCNTLVEIGCSEDACGPSGLLSEICVKGLTPGDTYYIQLASFDEFTLGEIILDLNCPCLPVPTGACCLADGSCTVLTSDECWGVNGVYMGDGTSCGADPCSNPPDNDDCETAQEIPTLPATVIGDNTFATDDIFPGEECFLPGGPSRNVWYIVIGTGQLMTATTCSAVTEFDSEIAVYSGDCAGLVCVAGNDDDPECDFWDFTSIVSWNSTPGTIYYVTVGSYPGNPPGPFELTVTTVKDCNDNGIGDTFDILDGFSQDCNDNGVPDECEINKGAGAGFFCKPASPPPPLTECDPDCNQDGIPDECQLGRGGGDVITCSADKEVVPGSVACSAGGITTENQFARCFDGANFPADTTVFSMNFGLEIALSVSSPIVVTGTLYSIPACDPILLDGDLTILGSGSITLVGDGSEDGTIQTISFGAGIPVPAGTNVVAEIAYEGGNQLWPGSNPNGQTCLSYIASDSCGLPDLTDLGLIGFLDMHLIINIKIGFGGGGNDENGDGIPDDCNCIAEEDCDPTHFGCCLNAAGEECTDPDGFGCDCIKMEDCVSAECGNGELEGSEECDDGNTDDGDCCSSTCTIEDQTYGDICEPFAPNGPQPDLDDILCELDDFADGSSVSGCPIGCGGGGGPQQGTTDIHPCPEDGGGDGTLNLDDILKMLDAFGGVSPCDDPCP